MDQESKSYIPATANVLLVIPARYASTRFPGKPLADIGGKPMIQWVWEQAKSSKLTTDVAVATDDQRIMDTVLGFGGKAIMTDPQLASGTERMAAVAEELSADIYVNVQGDEPLISPDTIDAAVRPLLDDQAIDIGTAAAIITDPEDLANPNVVKVVTDVRGRALYFSRSPMPYLRDRENVSVIPDGLFRKHIGIYAFRADALLLFAALPQSPLEKAEKLEQLRALQHGMQIHVAAVKASSQSVDIPADIEAVMAYMKNNPTGA